MYPGGWRCVPCRVEVCTLKDGGVYPEGMWKSLESTAQDIAGVGGALTEKNLRK